jgi:hypothetical protein
VHRYYRPRRGLWQHSAPIAELTPTTREIRRGADEILPGFRLRQLLLFRYLLIWDAP